MWEEAKNTNNYELFAPVLEEIISYNKKFAGYKQKEGQKLYDAIFSIVHEGGHGLYEMGISDELTLTPNWWWHIDGNARITIQIL